MPETNRKPLPKTNSAVRPTGKPLGWAPEEVYRRSDVTDEDKMSALAYWEANAPTPDRELLRAKRKGKP